MAIQEQHQHLSLNELSDPNFHALFNARHPNTFNNYLTIAPPAEILQLGESKALVDWKIAKHYLEEQKNKSEAYVDRRANFYKAAIVNNGRFKTNMHISEQEYSRST